MFPQGRFNKLSYIASVHCSDILNGYRYRQEGQFYYNIAEHFYAGMVDMGLSAYYSYKSVPRKYSELFMIIVNSLIACTCNVIRFQKKNRRPEREYMNIRPPPF